MYVKYISKPAFWIIRHSIPVGRSLCETGEPLTFHPSNGGPLTPPPRPRQREEYEGDRTALWLVRHVLRRLSVAPIDVDAANVEHLTRRSSVLSERPWLLFFGEDQRHTAASEETRTKVAAMMVRDQRWDHRMQGTCCRCSALHRIWSTLFVNDNLTISDRACRMAGIKYYRALYDGVRLCA